HHQIIGITAVRKHAEAAHRTTEVFVAALTRPAGAAADPRMGEPAVANLDALRIRAECHDLPDVLVAEGDRKLHAAIGKAHPLAAAQIEPAVGEVQITVAD